MENNFLNFIDFDRVNSLLEGFNQATGFVTAILDLEGNILSQSGWRRICTEFHRKNPISSVNCHLSDTELANNMRSGQKYHFYKCLNGLVDVAVPIVIKEQHIANLFSGQFFFEEPDIEAFRQQARQYGFDEDSYLQALKTVPIFTQEKVEETMNFLLSITQMIAELTYEKYVLMELYEAREKSEKDRRESDKYYRLLTENSLDVIWTADKNGILTYISPSIKNLSGYSSEDIMELQRKDYFIHENYKSIIQKLNDELIKPPDQQAPYINMELCFDLNENNVIYVNIKASWIKDTHGNLIGIHGSAQNITEQKQLEKEINESKLMYRSVVDTQHEMICRYRPDTTLTFVNDAFCRYFRTQREELIGQSFLMFIPHKLEASQLAFFVQFNPNNPSVNREIEVELGDGSIRWQDWTIIAIFNESGDIIELQGVGSDITKRKKAEEALLNAYDATIEGWSFAIDLKDKETQNHSLRVAELTINIAKKIGIPEEEMIHIRRGALLHDIGKMGIPDEILQKAGSLTEEEWKIMKKHPVYAYDMLSKIEYLNKALEIPYCHHEKWDGSGYPRGLKGEQIPVAARIFAVVDVYDALTSDRPYRKAWPILQTLEHIKSLKGTHFDPQIVDAFFKEIEVMD